MKKNPKRRNGSNSGGLVLTVEQQHKLASILEAVEADGITGEAYEETNVSFRSEEFTGPLPPPAILKQYDEAMPGLAERIVSYSEKEQKFRHDAVSEDQKSDREFRRIMQALMLFGQICALATISGVFWVAWKMIQRGDSNFAAWMVGGAVSVVAGVFVFTKRSNSSSKTDKKDKD